jgi:hypothetical protein
VCQAQWKLEREKKILFKKKTCKLYIFIFIYIIQMENTEIIGKLRWPTSTSN